MNKDVCYAKSRSAGGESCTRGWVFLLRGKEYSCLPYPLTLNSVCWRAHLFKGSLSRSYIFLYMFLAKKKESRKKHVHKGATLRKPCPSLFVSYAVVFKWNKCAFTFCHTHTEQYNRTPPSFAPLPSRITV